MQKTWLVVGALNAFVSVAMGAFGAHGLKNRVAAELLPTFETGARYQMYHALALLAVGMLWAPGRASMANAAGYGFLVGILLFSGSLYALVLSGVRALGAITPIGGVAFLVGWALFCAAALRTP